MTKLVTVEDFRNRAVLQDIAQLNAIADRVLESVSNHLEAALSTHFAKEEYVEVFWLDQFSRPFPHSQPVLLLGNGFVHPDEAATPFEVRMAEKVSELDAAALVDESEMLLDFEKGRVVLTGYDIEEEREKDLQRYVQVTYTAGFAATNEVFDGVPEWLQEMAVIKGMKLYAEVADSPDFKPDGDLSAFLSSNQRSQKNEVRPLV